MVNGCAIGDDGNFGHAIGGDKEIYRSAQDRRRAMADKIEVALTVMECSSKVSMDGELLREASKVLLIFLKEPCE